VLAVIDTFDISHTNQSLSDIARRAGLPLATAYRLVGELVAWRGLARRDDGRYEIGVRLWEVGLVDPLHLRLREVVLPFLQTLYEATARTSTSRSATATTSSMSRNSRATGRCRSSRATAAGCHCTHNVTAVAPVMPWTPQHHD
jgi:DNA-binding IclR family transcriptional regulator